MMDSFALRKHFFTFFERNNHTKVSSSSLIPAQDPTLLFANAGMNQFKDVFLGKETRSYTRAVTIQKCVRAGGKHNDLDNVGFTKRHLTFFEMMGNFSFGDYFKKEAIELAWQFLTQEVQLPRNKLHATVFETDEEAYAIWKEVIGLPEDQIHRLGAADNFWQMGDTGPCGPCSEILIDRGSAYNDNNYAETDIANQGERYLEVWNLVFMQYDRQADGSDSLLSRKGVDTGMGLERLALIMQDKDSVYQTDLFAPLIAHISKISGKVYSKQSDAVKNAFHVLCDHIRSTCLIITDGGSPSNEGRGYVLRKIIRRAALFAQKLDTPNAFETLAPVFINFFSSVYPELKENEAIICTTIGSEIEKFSENLLRGQSQLERIFQQQQREKKITGAQAFKLYDTYGFPLELVQIISSERGFSVDNEGFHQYMQQQKEQSGAKKKDILSTLDLPQAAHTRFTGYQELTTHSTIAALVVDDQLIDSVNAGIKCWIIPQESPFFIVGGGQVPDQGTISIQHHAIAVEQVRHIGQGTGILVTMPIPLTVTTPIIQHVDKVWRTNAMKNHTATHLLQAALMELFGKQIKQSGSLVHPDYLRFDFTFHRSLSRNEIRKVEQCVNQKIRENIPVEIINTTYKNALQQGALAFFGDKYNPEKVRMIKITDFSVELCGGTHVQATGDIGTFKITEVNALSAGHRRITAVTGPKAIELFQQTYDTIKSLSVTFSVPQEGIMQTVEKLKADRDSTTKEVKRLAAQLAHAQIPVWLSNVIDVNGIATLVQATDGMSIAQLKEIVEKLNSKAPGFYLFTSDLNGKVVFYAHADISVCNKIDTRVLAAWLKQYDIKGGGNVGSLQGGTNRLPQNFQQLVLQWIAQQ